MSADFWAGYISGAAGIVIGNPLDLVKTRLQAGHVTHAASTPGSPERPAPKSVRSHFDRLGTLVRGISAPIIGYGALNALLFVSYNRSLGLMTGQPYPAPAEATAQTPSYAKIWMAGAIAGFTTFIVSAPTEVIKCRTQVSTSSTTSSWSVARDTLKAEGLRGLYQGGGVTSVRDAVGYGFYFWSYEWAKRIFTTPHDNQSEAAYKVLLCGGFAGVVTWASVFPLDVIKTRVQTQAVEVSVTEASPLVTECRVRTYRRRSTWAIARDAYAKEGVSIFFRGLGVCSVRAFIVNAVQWAVYEWMMKVAFQG